MSTIRVIEVDEQGNHTEAIIEKTATQLGAEGGIAGADGKTVRSGSGTPASELGVDGDFYINTVACTLYGPKISGAWGSPISLVGSPGDPGAKGDKGDAGNAIFIDV